MSTFEDAIWNHLVERHGADRREFHVPAAPKRVVRPRIALASAAALAATVAVVLLVLSASTSPPPAYALTQVAGGSYTVSLYDISRAVPELNAKFAQLGIRVTVVPVVAGCRSPVVLQGGPGGITSMSETVRISNRGIPPGWRGFLAAERLPSGLIGLAQGDTPQPIPTCYPTTVGHGIPVPPRPQRHSRASGG
jgi:hypothetical protein